MLYFEDKAEEHQVFRAASGFDGSTSLYDLWTSGNLEPSITAVLGTSHFSQFRSSENIFKSPIPELAWGSVTQVTVHTE